MSPGSSRTRNIFEPLDRSEVAALWGARFGIPESAFEGYRFFRKAQSVWVVSDADLPALSYEALGMRMMSMKDRLWKPTTCALQIFGRFATRNLVHLTGARAAAFLAGESQQIESSSESCSKSSSEFCSASPSEPCCESGYVVVFYRGEVLGCGLYSRGRLISQIPKEFRTQSFAEGEEI